MEENQEDIPKIKGAEKQLIPNENSEESEDSDNEVQTEQSQTETQEQPTSNENSEIYVIKVTTNKEDNAFEMIADRIKKKNLNVYSLARPHGLRGYVFLESPDRDNAEESVFNLPYVKGILPRVLKYADVKSMMQPVTADIKIEKNDVVEMIAEPFKKEKAKVIRVDKAKGEVVVSLLGSVVPIPTTVKIDNVRVIRREDEELDEIS